MRTRENYPDVFLSYSSGDKAAAKVVRESLLGEGFVVFDSRQIGPWIKFSDKIWRALVMSEALVLVIPPDGEPLPNSATELGAAMAWQKPVYVVRPANGHAKKASYLRKYKSYPLSRVDDLAKAIRRSRKSLSERELDLLKELYSESGVPVDRLLLEPSELDELASRFAKRIGRQVSGESMMEELIRLRKKGTLPRLRRATASARRAS